MGLPLPASDYNLPLAKTGIQCQWAYSFGKGEVWWMVDIPKKKKKWELKTFPFISPMTVHFCYIRSWFKLVLFCCCFHFPLCWALHSARSKTMGEPAHTNAIAPLKRFNKHWWACPQNNYNWVFLRKEWHSLSYQVVKETTLSQNIDFWLFKVHVPKRT